MQATVLTFDPSTMSGTVVADDGVTLAFGAEAFASGGLRLLRPGQRVRLAQSEDGIAESITLVTFGLPQDAAGDRT